MIRSMTRRDWLHYAASLTVLLTALFAEQIVRAVAPAPFVYLNVPFPVLHQPVHAGDPVVMRIDRCIRDVDVPIYVVTRELRNVQTGHRTVLGQTHDSVRLGCETIRAQSAELPDDVEPGVYTYRGVTMVRGRWVHAEVPWETEPFEIVEREHRP